MPSLKTSVSNPVDITASSLEYNKEKNTYTAKGDVDLRDGLRLLRANLVTYNDETQEVYAEGDVVFKDGDDMVECNKMHLNLVTKTGTIEKGRIFIKQGDYYIGGEQIQKTGESTYIIEKGELTTCGWDKPAWRFSAKNVEITVEGYAKAKEATFHVAGRNLFSLPYALLPIKTERQTGILMPQFLRSSSDGFVVRNAYYWAISKDKDATFYLDYIENRGPKVGAEFRYALREDLKGAWFASFIDDIDYRHSRYQIRGYHEQAFANDFVLKSNINYVSDMFYLRDFAYLRDFFSAKEFALDFSDRGATIIDKSETQIKSTAFVEKPLPHSFLTFEMAYFRDLKDYANRHNDYTFQFLPYISFFTEYLPIGQDMFLGNMNSTFINFYRNKGSRFSRLQMEPTIRYPFAYDGLNVLFSGGLQQMMYFGESGFGSGGNNESRSIGRFTADANMQFMRNYFIDFMKLGEIVSIIKPQIKYTYISNSSFTDIPRLDEFDPFNPVYRTYGTNAVSYGISHFLNTSTSEGFREVSLFEIFQTYGLSRDLNPSVMYQGSGTRFSDVNARLNLYLTQNLMFNHQSAFNVYGDGFSTIKNALYYSQQNLGFVNVALNYNNVPANYNNVATNYNKVSSNQLLFDAGFTYFKDFDFRYYVQYSIKDNTALDSAYQVTYHPKCWAVTLAVFRSANPSDTTVKLSVDLSGLTSGKY